MKTYFYSLFLSLIYIFPIISAKVLYQDDVSRTLRNSAYTWLREGRPLMAGIHYFLNFDTVIFNTAPLTQILGVAALCYAGYLFIKKYKSDLPEYLKVLSILSLIISPFFLENLCFGFESIGFCFTLAISLLICCFSLSLVKTGLVSAVGMFLLLSIYQPAVSAPFIVAMTVLYFQPQTWKLFFVRVIGMLSGVLVYTFTIARTITRQGYDGVDVTSVFHFNEFLQNLSNFMTHYKELFFSDTSPGTLVLSGIVIVAVILSIVAHILTDAKDYKWVCVLPLVAFLSTVLPLCFLGKSLSDPVLGKALLTPRILISFNVVCFFVMLMLSQLCIRRSLFIALPVTVMIWAFSFSYMFGGILTAQEKYENYVVSCIFHDIGKLEVDNNTKYHYIGHRLICYEAKKAEKKYKLFESLNNVMFRNDRGFWIGAISHYLNRPVKSAKYDKENYPVLVNHELYMIAGDKNHIFFFIK